MNILILISMDINHYYIIADKNSKYDYGKLLPKKCFELYKSLEDVIEYIHCEKELYIIELYDEIYIKIIDKYELYLIPSIVKNINCYSNKYLKHLFLDKKIKLLKMIFIRSDTESILSSKFMIYMYRYDIILHDEIDQRIYNNILLD